MKLTTIVLGLGILGSAAAFTAWEHRAARNSRNEVAHLAGELEKAHIVIRVAQDKINTARKELKALDEQVAGLEQMAAPGQQKQETGIVSLGEAAWQPNVTYVDLPKSSLKSIHALVLNVDNEITPDAVALFGLTTAERDSVRDLYKEMTAWFEQLERDHLTRTNQHNPRAVEWARDKISFAIHPFPAEADALRAQWSEKLERLAGPSRAELIAEGVRNSPNSRALMRMRNRLSGEVEMRLMRRGQNWLSLNSQTPHITFLMGDGASIEGYFEASGGGIKGSQRADMQIPERWRHLVTEEMLQAR